MIRYDIYYVIKFVTLCSLLRNQIISHIILEINQETKQYKQKYDEVMEKKTSLYNTELHLGKSNQ